MIKILRIALLMKEAGRFPTVLMDGKGDNVLKSIRKFISTEKKRTCCSRLCHLKGWNCSLSHWEERIIAGCCLGGSLHMLMHAKNSLHTGP